jgi:hypothetical protein
VRHRTTPASSRGAWQCPANWSSHIGNGSMRHGAIRKFGDMQYQTNPVSGVNGSVSNALPWNKIPHWWQNNG